MKPLAVLLIVTCAACAESSEPEWVNIASGSNEYWAGVCGVAPTNPECPAKYEDDDFEYGGKVCVHEYRRHVGEGVTLSGDNVRLNDSYIEGADQMVVTVGLLEGTDIPCINGIPPVRIDRDELMTQLLERLELGVVMKDGKAVLEALEGRGFKQ